MNERGNQPVHSPFVLFIFLTRPFNFLSNFLRIYKPVKSFFILWVFLLYTLSSSAQNRSLDSLHNLLKTTTANDTLKINLLTEPLTELNQKMVTTMSQNPSDDTSVKHGMDATLITIDKEKMELQFAGAHNPLYQVREGILTEIKADKVSVGSYKDGKPVEFKNHIIPVQKGDIFYLFSDGFPDQIGGPNRKKFYYPPFKELLVSIHKLEVHEQKTVLDQTITEWKGERDQTDDILIAGILI